MGKKWKFFGEGELGETYSYNTLNKLGVGGNGEVYSCAKKDAGSNDLAVKFLMKNSSRELFIEKVSRFKSEIEIVRRYQNEIHGILPILDFYLPDETSIKLDECRKHCYWYVMPKAKSIDYLQNSGNIDEKVDCIISIARTLTELHSKGIVHRDIKPNNIYKYDDEFVLGDFGLVDYPEKPEVTKTLAAVGAKATIAPEMLFESKHADGKKADVFSLAKTLWMIISNNQYSFPGSYNPDNEDIGLRFFHDELHLVELDKLLVDSTDFTPYKRPSMSEFLERLMKWKEIKSDNYLSNQSDWKFVQEKLFNGIVPARTEWNKIDDIIFILNTLGKIPSLNHMFFPEGGGGDLIRSGKAAEDGCIEISIDYITYIVKPKSLCLENINNNFEWSYFRLNLDDITPNSSNEGMFEALTEDFPGHYVSYLCSIYGHYENGEELPLGFRRVQRYWKSSSFVIFCKSSIYNKISATYDGRHNEKLDIPFREYVREYCALFDYLNGKYTRDETVAILNALERKQKGENDIYYDEKMKRESLEKIEIQNYLTEHIEKWEFLDILDVPILNTEKPAYFTLRISFDNFLYEDYYLYKNGTIKKGSYLNRPNFQEQLVFNSIAEAKESFEVMSRYISTKCEENGMLYKDNLKVSIDLNRNILIPPKHLVTKEEIEKEIYNGDDSQNNVLVIDVNGNVYLIKAGFSYENSKYPVRIESYSAYNNYVGQYASMEFIDEIYSKALDGWLSYLKNGQSVSADFYEQSVEELLSQIRDYYEK